MMIGSETKSDAATYIFSGKQNSEGNNSQDELLNKKRVHYGDIHSGPHSQLTIAVRMLDKTRRLVQREMLRYVLDDFGDIDMVRDRVGNIDEVEEDTVADLSNYLKLYKEGIERVK